MNSQLIAVLERPSSPDEYGRICRSLDDVALSLGKDPNLRRHLGTSSPSIWPALGKMWGDTAATVEKEEEETGEAALVTSLARVTRNLVAGIAHNQEHAFAFEPFVSRLIRVYTSWTRESEESSRIALRMLTQLLSNVVTVNDGLQTRLIQRYLIEEEERSLLIRLAESHDAKTILALLVLLLNCIRQSRTRAEILVKSITGNRLCIALLDKVEDNLDEDPAQSGGQVFELGYALFTSLFEHGLFGQLYSGISIQDEPISPPQTTLLKLLDSYLQARIGAEPELYDAATTEALVSTFDVLSSFVQKAIAHAVPGHASPPPTADSASASAVADTLLENDAEMELNTPGAAAGLRSLDLQLPPACAALVLVAQCLHALLLAESEAAQPTDRSKNVVLKSPPDVIESLLDTLRQLDIFLPRIAFGKVTPSPAAPPSAGAGDPSRADAHGFAYVKRDLVRLLGTLVHGSRSAQDRVRTAKGIEVILNLCVVDERNPYLREHAIFALRNLLHENKENQAVVEELKPVGTWDGSAAFEG
ncbi:hypothetical protein PENSPDRAFT_742856 [Peniophora sp. CONT]|nr:hypothetical protein PENSPDRAFT_742856 [Peniophora sp. CONT]